MQKKISFLFMSLLLVVTTAYGLEEYGKITVLQGRLAIIRDDGVMTYDQGDGKISVLNNDVLRVGQSSAAILETIENTTIKIGSNAVFEVRPWKRKSKFGYLRMLFGKGIFHTKKLFKRKRFRIKTATATIGVKGTTCSPEVTSIGNTSLACQLGTGTMTSTQGVSFDVPANTISFTLAGKITKPVKFEQQSDNIKSDSKKTQEQDKADSEQKDPQEQDKADSEQKDLQEQGDSDKQAGDEQPPGIDNKVDEKLDSGDANSIGAADLSKEDIAIDSGVITPDELLKSKDIQPEVTEKMEQPVPEKKEEEPEDSEEKSEKKEEEPEDSEEKQENTEEEPEDSEEKPENTEEEPEEQPGNTEEEPEEQPNEPADQKEAEPGEDFKQDLNDDLEQQDEVVVAPDIPDEPVIPPPIIEDPVIDDIIEEGVQENVSGKGKMNLNFDN